MNTLINFHAESSKPKAEDCSQGSLTIKNKKIKNILITLAMLSAIGDTMVEYGMEMLVKGNTKIKEMDSSKDRKLLCRQISKRAS